MGTTSANPLRIGKTGTLRHEYIRGNVKNGETFCVTDPEYVHYNTYSQSEP